MDCSENVRENILKLTFGENVVEPDNVSVVIVPCDLKAQEENPN